MPIDAESTGEGRNLVLLHSLLADRTAFDRVVPVLAARRRVWRVNLPGYGASEPAGGSIEDYADHLAQLLEATGTDTDILGNGFGGFIAVALAARHGAKFGHLIAAPALARFPDAAKLPLLGLAERSRRRAWAARSTSRSAACFPRPTSPRIPTWWRNASAPWQRPTRAAFRPLA